MEVSLPSSRKKGHVRSIICDAHIPLCYLKNISNGAVKKLAKRLHITTIEELYLIEKEKISDSIKSSRMRQEILSLKHNIEEKVRAKRDLFKFEEIAANKSIKIKPLQRQRLVGVEIFAKILKDIEELIKFLLGVNDMDIPFRERALLGKICDFSTRMILKKAS